MTSVLEFVPPPVWAQLWQITALILIVAILTRLFARNRHGASSGDAARHQADRAGGGSLFRQCH